MFKKDEFKSFIRIFVCRAFGQWIPIASLVILPLVGCQNDASNQQLALFQSDQAIVAGDVVEPTEKQQGGWVDYAVGLKIKKDITCSGTLIDKDLVLTAAHCVYGLNQPKDIQIHFGVNLQEKSFVLAKDYRVHPKYLPKTKQEDPSSDYDVAVILLEKEAPQWALAAKHFGYRFPYYENFSFVISGFGRTNGLEVGRPDQGILRTAEFEYEFKNLNGLTFSINQRLPDMFELEEKRLRNEPIVLRSGICGGDSGAGVLIEDEGVVYVVGIVRSTTAPKAGNDYSGQQLASAVGEQEQKSTGFNELLYRDIQYNLEMGIDTCRHSGEILIVEYQARAILHMIAELKPVGLPQ